MMSWAVLAAVTPSSPDSAVGHCCALSPPRSPEQSGAPLLLVEHKEVFSIVSGL